MSDAISGLAMKAVALLALLVCAYVLFKVVLGFVTGIVWILVIVIAIAGVFWAMSVLKR